ncbi:MAG TPA: GNAT family N-acetyltransferase [Opitutaceae bacterium]|nr:GNAT family N-acetyltransferase [Opitutaceae bacterium]
MKRAKKGTPQPMSARLFAGYTVRNLRMADFPEILALWRSCEGLGLNASDTRQAIGRFLNRNRNLSPVVCHQGKIVAAVLCGHDGRRGYLHHLAVAAAHRRNGIGRALAAECLRRLAALHVAKCNIFLYRTNAAGRAFWIRQGWTARADLIVVQRATVPLGVPSHD